jgi:hypothetical protein
MWGDSIISTLMLRQFGVVVVTLTIGSSSACRQKADDAKPVATPSVTLSRTTVPAGSPIDITYRFAVAPDAPAFTGDYVVFVHFLDDAGEQMWTDDHSPPTPTRDWKAATTIEYTRTLLMPRYPYVGAASVQLGLYAPVSGQRLPMAGDNAGMRSYRVGTLNITNDPDPVPVSFGEGWYDAESGEAGGQQWRWSKRQGTITFKNPNRDVTVFLQVDQAIHSLPEPQHIEVRAGGAVVDAFTLPPGVPELRQFPLSAEQLGPRDTGELTLTVDKTVAPAKIPELHSPDSRELGIRVFRAYILPK